MDVLQTILEQRARLRAAGGVYSVSIDVKAAFDHIFHICITEAVVSDGASSWLARAVEFEAAWGGCRDVYGRLKGWPSGLRERLPIKLLPIRVRELRGLEVVGWGRLTHPLYADSFFLIGQRGEKSS